MRSYHVIIGTVPYFNQALGLSEEKCDEFNNKVAEHDACRQIHSPELYSPSDFLVIRNNHYHSIVEQAHARLGGLIEDLTTDEATIYVHNPTSVLYDYLRSQQATGAIELHIVQEDRASLHEIEDVHTRLEELRSRIIGQDLAMEEIVKSLLYLANTRRKRPYVLMLYGNSSVGKTETAYAIADLFFDGKMIEKHLSMFETLAYADYLFGGKPNVMSLGYELNQRESNLLFLDEMDKCGAAFQSVFYTLFDSTTFRDSTYEVGIEGLVVLLTCNYLSEEEIRKKLGEPIYYRIDKFIPYKDFEPNDIKSIAVAEITKQISDSKITLDPLQIYTAVSGEIFAKGENGRTIQSKVRAAIEDEIYRRNL